MDLIHVRNTLRLAEYREALLPALVLLDWIVVGDRGALSWRRLWVVLPYPVVWVVVVLLRGATDGWVPYGFLLPENGAVSLVLHVAGLTSANLITAAVVWVLSRRRREAASARKRILIWD